jgi:hypothetical protein
VVGLTGGACKLLVDCAGLRALLGPTDMFMSEKDITTQFYSIPLSLYIQCVQKLLFDPTHNSYHISMLIN